MSKSGFSPIGLAGVSADESPDAIRLSKFLEWPMLLLAFAILLEWYLSVKGIKSIAFSQVTDWVIWLFFVVETLSLTYLVNDRKRYLLGNWMNLVIILAGIPVLWQALDVAPALRALRLFLIISLLVPLFSTFREVMSKNSLGITLFVSSMIIIMSGVLIAGIDPAFDNIFDGIWWAWVTVTTVGYGDFVPESVQGKLFGGFLILLGVGLFSLITASFSAFFVARETHEVIEEEQELELELRKALVNLSVLEKRLAKLEAKLDRLLDRVGK